jgi:solute carrier family 31 (copper transporter), member 1
MLFNWETTNLCIIFRRWQIRSTTGLIVSLILIALITAGYEALRECCRVYEARTTKKLPTVASKSAPLPLFTKRLCDM